MKAVMTHHEFCSGQEALVDRHVRVVRLVEFRLTLNFLEILIIPLCTLPTFFSSLLTLFTYTLSA